VKKCLIFMFSMILGCPCMIPAVTLDELIDDILAVRRIQFETVTDMVCISEQYEKSTDKNGNIKETKKLIKDLYIKKINQKWVVKEDFREYYLNGVKQDDRKLADEVKEYHKNKKRRGNRDLTYDLLAPLLAENRSMYRLELRPDIADVEAFDCYEIRATATADIDTLLNYTYYIDTVSTHLVRADFVPAKLTDNFFFKLKEFDMTMTFEPFNDSVWVPYRFRIAGQGKAILFIGVNFEAEEIFLYPRINVGLPDSLFSDVK